MNSKIFQNVFTNDDVLINQRTRVYDGFFKLDRIELTHRLFVNETSPPIVRELLHRGHAVAVLPYDPVLDKVVFIEQFRIGAIATKESPWLLEVVAGMIEPNESIESVATRELQEEAGINVEQLIPMLDYLSSPGGTSERIYLYLGIIDSQKVKNGIFGLEQEGEDIKVHTFDYNEMLKLMETGHLDNAATVIAVQWLQLNKHKLMNKENKVEPE